MNIFHLFVSERILFSIPIETTEINLLSAYYLLEKVYGVGLILLNRIV